MPYREDDSVHSVWTVGRSRQSRTQYTDPRLVIFPANTSKIKSITAGSYHTLVLTTDGRVFSWGENRYGQLGHGNYLPQADPREVSPAKGSEGYSYISAGSQHTLLISREKELLATGCGQCGRLGLGHQRDISRPLRVDILDKETHMLLHTEWSMVSAGDRHSLGVLAGPTGHFRAGDLFSWGDGSTWKLGTGDESDASTPTCISGGIRPTYTPAAVIAGLHLGSEIGITSAMDDDSDMASQQSAICAISAGFSHSLAVTVAGAIYSWGDGLDYKLGNGSDADVSRPRRIESLSATPMKLVKASLRHSLAVDATGQTYAWGRGAYGVLGLASWDDVPEASPVSLLSDSSASVKASIIESGPYHCGAVGSDGSLFTWGDGSWGKLASEEETDRQTPQLCRQFLPSISSPAGGKVVGIALGEDATFVIVSQPPGREASAAVVEESLASAPLTPSLLDSQEGDVLASIANHRRASMESEMRFTKASIAKRNSIFHGNGATSRHLASATTKSRDPLILQLTPEESTSSSKDTARKTAGPSGTASGQATTVTSPLGGGGEAPVSARPGSPRPPRGAGRVGNAKGRAVSADYARLPWVCSCGFDNQHLLTVCAACREPNPLREPPPSFATDSEEAVPSRELFFLQQMERWEIPKTRLHNSSANRNQIHLRRKNRFVKPNFGGKSPGHAGSSPKNKRPVAATSGDLPDPSQANIGSRRAGMQVVRSPGFRMLDELDDVPDVIVQVDSEEEEEVENLGKSMHRKQQRPPNNLKPPLQSGLAGFGTAARFKALTGHELPVLQGDRAEGIAELRESAHTEETEGELGYEISTSKAFSFGTAERFPKKEKRTAHHDDSDDSASADDMPGPGAYGVHELRHRIPGGVRWRPSSAPGQARKAPHRPPPTSGSKGREASARRASAKKIDTTKQFMKQLGWKDPDVLTTAAAMYLAMKVTPGPGAHHVADGIGSSTNFNVAKCTFGGASKKSTPSRVRSASLARATPGPGAYNISVAHSAVRSKAPAVTFAVVPHVPRSSRSLF